MDNKLKELTDRLYDDGLAKGRADAERLTENAKKEAAQIVADAKAEAEKIVKAAESKAADTLKNSLTEISLAGKEAVARIKNEIAETVTSKAIDGCVSAASVDAKFIEEMLVEVAKNWHADSSPAELKAIIPASMEKEFDAKFAGSVSAVLGEGIEILCSDELKSGFKIGDKNGGYYISFTEESFNALLKSYLREKVAKLLFE